jgi:SAM-dependent methyltransferase
LTAPFIFDANHYEKLNVSRGAVVSGLLLELRPSLDLQTAVDVGCGIGYFSGMLQSLGLRVTATDGRKENSEEAARRNPGISFEHYDAEDPALRTLGRFDLVFCFGLLYHLQNPLLAMGHLHAMTGKLLLVESVIFPGSDPVMGLVDEGPTEDQGLNHFAFYPTETCLEKMLFRAGFSFVYEFAIKPEHPGYHHSGSLPKIRTMLAASNKPLQSGYLKAVSEPHLSIQPWDANSAAAYLRLATEERPFLRKLKALKRIARGR